jgi:hypothetical protein
MVDLSILPIVMPMLGGLGILAITACCCAMKANNRGAQLYVRMNAVEEMTNRVATQQQQQQQYQQKQQQAFPPSYYPAQYTPILPTTYNYVQPQPSAPPTAKIV